MLSPYLYIIYSNIYNSKYKKHGDSIIVYTTSGKRHELFLIDYDEYNYLLFTENLSQEIIPKKYIKILNTISDEDKILNYTDNEIYNKYVYNVLKYKIFMLKSDNAKTIERLLKDINMI